MQCSQPFYGAGYPSNFGPSYPFNYSFPNVPQPSLFPEIIGEGEVASVVYPDGSIHLYFIPINKRFPSNNYHHQNNYAPYFNTMGAYYVRAISNPMSAALFNQQCQKMYTGPYSRPCYISDCNLNIPSPGFQLKFHNDCWTSTTDLHYFFPCIRECDWFPSTQLKRCASVQVDIPDKENTVYREAICAKPCLCSKIESTVYHEPLCPKPCSCSQNEDIKQSEDESDDECQNSIISERKQNKNKKSRARKQKLEKKKSDVICECNEANTTDKSIATVTDQGSSCVANERDTQTSKPASGAAMSFPGVSSVNKSDVKTELWLPKKSSFGKTVRIKSSENITGVYETGSSSATCCCSDGD